ERSKEYLSSKIGTFQLQEFVKGVEIGASRFFNGKDFVGPVCMGVEYKRLCSGDVGPLTGEMGTLIFWRDDTRLFRETTSKLKSQLAAVNYVGYIDINCIVNAGGIFPLELTCRFGYP